MTAIDVPYHEFMRPQVHFTAEKNWLNDPNGLVYYKGEYNLFFQYNAKSRKWGPQSWGHAVSRDLVHWQQLPDAIDPDGEFGWIWSGSAVVDWKNTSGLRTGAEDVLVAIYTTGDPHARPPKPCVQGIAFSNDRGRTWTKYPGNPVIAHIVAENRDPKVFWHEPTQSWIMAFYLEKNLFTFYRSPDLIHWTHFQDLDMPGTTECPDFFELPVAGKPGLSKWVFWGADGNYFVGSFDGKKFVPESGVLQAEYGPNGYAAQTWNDMPASDGRRIQISWMRDGKYPFMPFNQQMSFPLELTLQSFPEGIRLCRNPVKELELLHDKTSQWSDVALKPGALFQPKVSGDVFDIHLTIEPGATEAVGLNVHGINVGYNRQKGILVCLGRELPVPTIDGKVSLELLVDRTSLEIFAQDGSVSASFCYIAEAADAPLDFYAVRSDARIVSLTVHTLKSIWP